jgi:hypothetical protein
LDQKYQIVLISANANANANAKANAEANAWSSHTFSRWSAAYRSKE